MKVLACEEEHVLGFANVCQVLALRLQTSTSREDATRLLWEFIRKIPEPSGTLSDAIIWNLVMQFSLRMRAHLHDAGPLLRDAIVGVAAIMGTRSPYAGLAAVIDCIALGGQALTTPSPDTNRSPERRVRAAHPRLDKALAFIAERYAAPDLTLDAVARAAGLSRWHLGRVIKEHTGKTFLQYLHAIRMQRVEDLLEYSTNSIKQVAARTGYLAASTLDRDFRRSHGCTPREWRNKRVVRRADAAQIGTSSQTG